MNLLSIGISHHTASLEIRERMWMSADEVRQLLPYLKERFFGECMIVSTCNRTELYGIAPNGKIDDLELKKFLIDAKGAGSVVDLQHFVHELGGSAVHHLFRVASGIDSMVIGDIQILNQVKEAYNLSVEMKTMGPVMNRLMQSALHVGKRTRSETAICEGAVSVSYAAVELANKIFADLSRRSALLIGAGETGELTLKHLVSRGMGQVRVANRTREKAEALVSTLGSVGTVVDYDKLTDALFVSDIVITSVASPSYVVQPEHTHTVMKKRSNDPLFIIDIGVPRNVDPACNKVDNVFLYDMDSLSSIVDRNLEKRKAEIPKVTAIIQEELAEFFRWYDSLQVGPAIKDLREAFETIRLQEIGEHINRFKPEDRDLVELVTKRIINKILHQPITNLKEGAADKVQEGDTLLRIKALRELFGISATKRDASRD